ncbi:hypothetical protein C8R45DRAFT_1094686 [Mycena sanguinolenta]|nr:hypothetical protein C8R45DRAFT_1094686 [Mycena sanguinolenta]
MASPSSPLALASTDAPRDWFFWTWKFGPALDGVVRSPQSSYQLELQNGSMPTDLRGSVGIAMVARRERAACHIPYPILDARLIVRTINIVHVVFPLSPALMRAPINSQI